MRKSGSLPAAGRLPLPTAESQGGDRNLRAETGWARKWNAMSGGVREGARIGVSQRCNWLYFLEIGVVRFWRELGK